MPTTKLLSLCCGALPLHGVVNERFGHRTGHCGLCQEHTTFAPGGMLERQPHWLTLPPLRPLKRIVCSGCDREVDVPADSAYTGQCYDCWDESCPGGRPPSAEQQLTRIERRLALGDLLGCVGGLLCGALILLAIFYASWWLGERESRERGAEGLVEQGLGGAHGPTLPEGGAK